MNHRRFYDNDDECDNEEERYVRAKLKEMKCLDYKQLNEFFEYLFVCCSSTKNSQRNCCKKKNNDIDSSKLTDFFSPIFHTSNSTSKPQTNYISKQPIIHTNRQHANSTNKQHVLKSRNITFIGGKTIYGQRVSTI